MSKSKHTGLGIALGAALGVMGPRAHAFDETRYPDLKGAWVRTTPPEWVLPGEKPAPPLVEVHRVDDDLRASAARTASSWTGSGVRP